MEADFPLPLPPGGASAAYHANDHRLSPSPPLSTTSSTAATPPTLAPSDFPPNSAPPVRRKPLPQNAAPMIPSHHRPGSRSSEGDALPVHSSSGKAVTSPAVLPPSPTYDDTLPFVPRDLDRFPHQKSVPRLSFDSSSSVFDVGDDDAEYGYTLTDGTPLHARLISEPLIPVLNPSANDQQAESMALHPPTSRPPPLKIDPNGRKMSGSSADSKQPKTPGSKISSFFGWKASSSPGADSTSTEISDSGRSPVSPKPHNFPNGRGSVPAPVDVSKANGYYQPVRHPSLSSASATNVHSSKLSELENELREISSELAGSIRREMELEDLVEKLQSDIAADPNRRTSDYFSDSGTSSIRNAHDGRIEDIEKIRRAAEQERAQLKVEFSNRWQEERSQRTTYESHVQLLENQVQQLRRERTDLSDMKSKNRELEIALEDTRRKLMEERQVKDNFEDLLTAMRVELEQLRNERDHYRDNAGAPLPHDQDNGETETERLLGEIEALKIENASLAQLHGGRFASIAEEDSMVSPRGAGLSRSNSLARASKPHGFSRPNSLSRSSSVTAKDHREGGESLVDRMKDTEAQRDALHQSLTRLLRRQAYEARQYEKRTRVLEIELARAKQVGSPRRLGYEREVGYLREEVNHLRQQAQDALDQKWQCEKGLAGLKMDLDRAEQETSSLRVLLQEHDISVPDELNSHRDGFAEVLATSSSLESAYHQLQADRENAQVQPPSPELEASFSRTDALADNVRQQLENNSSLRSRLADAIGKGEKDQQVSVTRINELQNRLKELEDLLMTAQQQSEEEMAKHEEEIRQLQESHNAQLLRITNGGRSPAALSPRPPHSPFGDRSPQLDKTTSGDGIPLAEAIHAEVLEKRVRELKKLLRDADMEMEEVVGRMNRAQIEVGELQSDRDEALRQTRRLQAEIQAEREAFQALMG